MRNSYCTVNDFQRPGTAYGTAKRPLSIIELMVSGVAFAYVVSVYLFVSVDVLSRLGIVLAALLWVSIAIMALSGRKLSVPPLIVLPWIFFAFTALSLLWVQNLDYAANTEMPMFTAILGGTGIWLALENGLSWKTLAWAAVLGALILMVSARGEVQEEGVAGPRRGARAKRQCPGNLFVLCGLHRLVLSGKTA